MCYAFIRKFSKGYTLQRLHFIKLKGYLMNRKSHILLLIALGTCALGTSEMSAYCGTLTTITQPLDQHENVSVTTAVNITPAYCSANAMRQTSDQNNCAVSQQPSTQNSSGSSHLSSSQDNSIADHPATDKTSSAPSSQTTDQHDKTVTAKILHFSKGSTMTFCIQKLSDLYGYEVVIQGTNDIEVLRDFSIDLTNYKDSLAALIKGYPVHIDLYEANHVAVVSILNNQP